MKNIIYPNLGRYTENEVPTLQLWKIYFMDFYGIYYLLDQTRVKYTD